MGPAWFIALSALAVIVGLILLAMGLLRGRNASGQNEYTLEPRSNSTYVIAGLLSLGLGFAGCSMLGGVGV